MLTPLRYILRMVAGVVLILAGIAGLILPIIPGWALIAAGVLLLAPNSRASHAIKSGARRLVEIVRRAMDVLKRRRAGAGRKDDSRGD